MNSKVEFYLLADIARLLKKYGPESFESLVEYLEKPGAVDQLVSLISISARAGEQAKSKTVKKGIAKSKRSNDFLYKLEMKDPEKAQVLFGFRDSLLAKKVLPTLREIKLFALDNGLAKVNAMSRDKAINPLLKDLTNRATNDIKAMVAYSGIQTPKNERSLEGWANIILDKERHSKI